VSAAWGADPALSAAKEAHLALQNQKFLDRSIADLKAGLLLPRPDASVAGLAWLDRHNTAAGATPTGFPTPQPSIFGNDPDTNRDGVVSFEERLLATTPTSWGSRTLAKPGTVPPGPIVGGAALPIPDPLDIVKRSLWPPGMEHWGLQQRIGWVQALAAPWMSTYWMRNRLAQATGLLYEQYSGPVGGVV
jgi:hypothetical protein